MWYSVLLVSTELVKYIGNIHISHYRFVSVTLVITVPDLVPIILYFQVLYEYLDIPWITHNHSLNIELILSVSSYRISEEIDPFMFCTQC